MSYFSHLYHLNSSISIIIVGVFVVVVMINEIINNNNTNITIISSYLYYRNCISFRSSMASHYCYNNGCPMTGAVCRDGVCKCSVIGQRYQPSSDSCVNSKCNNRSSAFLSTSLLPGLNTQLSFSFFIFQINYHSIVPIFKRF